MTALLLTITLLAPGDDPADSDPRAELKTAIAYALDLLEKEDYQQFIQQMAHPEDLKSTLAARKLDELVRSFSKEKGAVTLTVFKRIQSADPQLSDDGRRAVFTADVPGFSPKKLTFSRVDGLWYLRN